MTLHFRRSFRRIALLSGACALFALPSWAFLPDKPFAGLDDFAVFVASFETTTDGEDRSGASGVKSTGFISPGGVFGTNTLRNPVDGVVGLYSTPDEFNPAVGTIELWVTPSSSSPHQHLFSIRGRKSLDGDPWGELVVGEQDDGFGGPTDAAIYFSDNAGNLDLAHPTTFPSTTLRGVSSIDLDGDGQLDLLASMIDAHEVHIHRGPILPDTDLGAPDLVLGVPEPQGHTAVDLDQDGDLDLVVASFATDTKPLYGFENDGQGKFTPYDWGFDAFPPFPGAEGTAAGDVNGDGVVDLLYGSFSNVPSVLFFGSIDTRGNYSINPVNGVGFPDKTLGVSLADLDGDEWLDVVLARPGGDTNDSVNGEVLVFLNRGGGSFVVQPDHTLPSPGAFVVQATKDVDHDGFLDLSIANWESSESKILRGPDFASALSFGANEAVSFTLGDLDQDGLDDLFLRTHEGTSSPLYYLDEDGASKGSVDLPTGDTVIGMGSHITSGGTNPYGSTFEHSNSIDLWIEEGEVWFRVVDDDNHAHLVSAPFPGPLADRESGFHFVKAEWDANLGRLEVSVGDPSLLKNVFTTEDAPFSMGSVQEVFRLGTDLANQRALADGFLDDVRLSDVRRSQHVCQRDLGNAGPGNTRFSVCGQYLRPGNTATLELTSDPFVKPAWLLLSGVLNPTHVPQFGGRVIAPLNQLLFVPFKTNFDGSVTREINGAGLGSLSSAIYAQFVVQDPSQSSGYSISNALELRYQIR